jgi:hypothetical protein
MTTNFDQTFDTHDLSENDLRTSNGGMILLPFLNRNRGPLSLLESIIC